MPDSSGSRPLRVVVLRPGPHPYANTSLPQALASHLGAEVITIDVVDRLRRDRGRVARLAAAAFRAYGKGILRGRYRAKDAALRTPTAAKLLRRTALEAVAELGLAEGFVTLQMQSLFDGHIECVPHFVYTDHTHLANLQYDSFDPRSLYSSAWVAEERLVYENASAIFVRSRHVARSLESDYGVRQDKIALVYAGANVVAGRPAQPAKSMDVVFVGVDWERKGGPTLVSAFERVHANHPDASLTIVGCEPPAIPGMRVVGRIPLGEVGEYLAEAGVFALPTTVEPFGVAFVEAMAHGLPVVSTNVGAVPDLVDDGVNGFLVAPGDVAGLAAALEKLLSDPQQRREAGAQSLKLVADRYNWASVVKRMLPYLQAGSHPQGVVR